MHARADRRHACISVVGVCENGFCSFSSDMKNIALLGSVRFFGNPSAVRFGTVLVASARIRLADPHSLTFRLLYCVFNASTRSESCYILS